MLILPDSKQAAVECLSITKLSMTLFRRAARPRNDDLFSDLITSSSSADLTATSTNDEDAQHQDETSDNIEDNNLSRTSSPIQMSKTHIVALSDQWIELQCPLARELPNQQSASSAATNQQNQLATTTTSKLSQSNPISTNTNNLMAIVWRKNGANVSPSPRIKINSTNGSLIISGAQPKIDEGRYQCALVVGLANGSNGKQKDSTGSGDSSSSTTTSDDNKQTTATTKQLRSRKTGNQYNWKTLKAHQFDLKLIDAPRLAPFEFPQDATVGMRVLLTCSILRGQQPISFAWLKDNQIIAPTTSHANMVEQANGGLSLGQLHRQQLAEKRHLAGGSGSGNGDGNGLNSNIKQQASSTTRLLKNNDELLDASEDVHGQGAGRMRLDYVIYNAAPSGTLTPDQQLHNNNNQVLLRSLPSSTNVKLLASTTGSDPSNSQISENRLLPLLSDPSIRIRQSDDYSILSIEGLELKHSGRYTCSAQNEAAQASHSSQLIINAPPTFVAEPRDADLVSGHTARIDCAATGQPRPTISWHRARESGAQQWDYAPIYDNLRYTILPNGSLQIANVSQREQGYFLCSARNGFDPELTKLIRLTIHEPARFASRFKTQEARLEERVSIACAASGEPPITLEWLDREGKPIDSSSSATTNPNLAENSKQQYLIDTEPEASPNATSSISKLIILKTKRSDTGHYTCQATNKYGSDRMIVNLLVQHVPDKVTDLKVTNINSTTISLRWLPGNNGNSPINSYLVQYQSDDPLDDIILSSSMINGNLIGDGLGQQQQQVVSTGNSGSNPSEASIKFRNEIQTFLKSTLDSISVTSSSYDDLNDEAIDRTLVELTVESPNSHLIIKDLLPSCLYRLRLAAINKIGLGQFSDWIRAKTEQAAPSASAQKITAIATGPNSIKLSWLPPDRRAWNGPLIGFNIAYRPIDSTFEYNKTFEWTAPSLQSLIKSSEHPDQLHKELRLTFANNGTSSSTEQTNSLQQQQQQISTGSKTTTANSTNSSGYYMLKQHLRQLLALQQQELVAHLTNLQRSTTYLVWLQAINSRGLSPQSHAISIKTLDDVPPSAPSIKIQSASANSITLTWSLLNNFISPANQYSLFYRKLPSQLSTSFGNHLAHGGNTSSAANMQQPSLDQSSNPPFQERTITSQQLIMAGNLFLGQDQVGDQSPGVTGNANLLLNSNNNNHHQQHYQQFVYTLDQLECGSVYELYMSTRNSVGKSEPSAIVTTRTTGEPPFAPGNKNILFARIGYNDVLLNLASWSNGGCPLTHMSIIYKPSPIPMASATVWQNGGSSGRSNNSANAAPAAHRNSDTTNSSDITTSIEVSSILLATLNGVDRPIMRQQQQQQHSTSVDQNGSPSMQQAMLHSPIFSLKNLSPSSSYELEIVAHNSAGLTRAQYEFVTSHPNDTRSGYSRKEGVFRIDQRGMLIDSMIGDTADNHNHQQAAINNQNNQKAMIGLDSSYTNLNSQMQFEPHQLAPLAFLVLCIILLVVSSTFCYYRFRDRVKFGESMSSRGHHHHHHHHRPSSVDTNINNESTSTCHHGVGHASSTICQSSPGSIGKSSMWRMNGHFANTLKRQQYQQQQTTGGLNDATSASPLHYCLREPMTGGTLNEYNAIPLLSNNNNSTTDDHVGNFAQSVSMRDFNLITGGNSIGHNQLPLLKTTSGNHDRHQHQSTTLNLKHYRSGGGVVGAGFNQSAATTFNGDTLLMPRNIATLRSRLISTTPYDDLLPHHDHNTLGHGQSINAGQNSFNDNSNTYQSRLLLAAAAAASASNQNNGTEGLINENQRPDYGYNIALGQNEPNYNNVPLDDHQQQAETSWNALAGITNYAIPSANAAIVDSIINGNSNNFRSDANTNQFNNHLECQVNECNNQPNINDCIQQILEQEYQQQQQQHHSNLIQSQQQQRHQQQNSKILNNPQDNNDNAQQQQHQTILKDTQITNPSVLGSSSGSSSSGIDLGQQSDIGSTSTATSANNNNHHHKNNIPEILNVNESLNISRM